MKMALQGLCVLRMARGQGVTILIHNGAPQTQVGSQGGNRGLGTALWRVRRMGVRIAEGPHASSQWPVTRCLGVGADEGGQTRSRRWAVLAHWRRSEDWRPCERDGAPQGEFAVSIATDGAHVEQGTHARGGISGIFFGLGRGFAVSLVTSSRSSTGSLAKATGVRLLSTTALTLFLCLAALRHQRVHVVPPAPAARLAGDRERRPAHVGQDHRAVARHRPSLGRPIVRRQPQDHVAVALAGAAQEAELVEDPLFEPDFPPALLC